MLPTQSPTGFFHNPLLTLYTVPLYTPEPTTRVFRTYFVQTTVAFTSTTSSQIDHLYSIIQYHLQHFVHNLHNPWEVRKWIAQNLSPRVISAWICWQKCDFCQSALTRNEIRFLSRRVGHTVLVIRTVFWPWLRGKGAWPFSHKCTFTTATPVALSHLTRTADSTTHCKLLIYKGTWDTASCSCTYSLS